MHWTPRDNTIVIINHDGGSHPTVKPILTFQPLVKITNISSRDVCFYCKNKTDSVVFNPNHVITIVIKNYSIKCTRHELLVRVK